MSLTVTTHNNSYEFSGPYPAVEMLNAESGVYLVSTKNPDGKHQVLDVGESGNVNSRVATHDRREQWKAKVRDGLFVSAHYCDEATRMALEKELRDFLNPPCGDR